MSNEIKNTLTPNDKEVLELLAKANHQYENYLNIANVASQSAVEYETEEPEYSWKTPLTFTFIMQEGK